MKLLLTTCFGIEDVVEKELKEKDEKSKVIEKRKGRVIVEVSDLEKVFSMRSVHHVIKLLSVFNFNNLKEIKQKLSEIDFSAELRETEKFIPKSFSFMRTRNKSGNVYYFYRNESITLNTKTMLRVTFNSKI